jgi:hypothetical protein
MKPIVVTALSLLTTAAILPAHSADYFGDLRSSYPDQWKAEEGDPLRIEMGVRYWYSKGGQEIAFGGDSVRTDDTSHILEAHFRIEDQSTSSYLKGGAGYAFATEGAYSTSLLPGEAAFSGGQIGHVGADFGYMPFGSETFRLGALAGYQYLRESPDKARADLLQFDGLNIHALRLGLTAKAELGAMADITAEVAGIPYAWVAGQTPNYVIADTAIGGLTANRVTGALDTAAYGASGELMLGLHPSENLTVRVGGRGWMLTGPTTANLTYSNSATPGVTYREGSVFDSLSLFRYGGLVEVTGRF